MNTDKMVFVFGSNEAGIHGAGAARHAYLNCGAIWGCGYGHTHTDGNRGSFAIPTKASFVHGPSIAIGQPLKPNEIMPYVDAFIAYAKGRKDLEFQVTAIGCGLAGHHHAEIAPLFNDAPNNCYFDDLWKTYLPFGTTRFWGTF